MNFLATVVMLAVIVFGLAVMVNTIFPPDRS